MPHTHINEPQGQDQKAHDVPSVQPQQKKSNRGFASMDPSKQKEIASKGGRAAHQKGTAHQFTPDEAREAGRKGGGTVSKDRQHMAEIGRIGGMSRGANRRSSKPPARGESEAPESSTGRGEDATMHTESSETEDAGVNTSMPHRGETRH